MEQRLSIITLGVKDVAAARRFYEALGWVAAPKSTEHIVFFQVGGMALALYPWALLAEDAQTRSKGPAAGFRGVTLAHNVREKASVARLLAEAEKAGGKILKTAQDVFWGGHSGYFADPDGHLWEVAWNPHTELAADGSFRV